MNCRLYIAALSLCLFIGAFEEVQSLPTFSGALSCAKDYLVDSVKEKLISKSAMVAAFRDHMQVVSRRYQAALASGELNGMDDQAKKDFYYKIVVEELRHLRMQIELGMVKKNDVGSSQDIKLSGCVDPDAIHKGWSPQAASAGLNDDDDDDDSDLDNPDRDRSAELRAELEELERQAAMESEMGWSMDPETKKALVSRARMVAGELLNNEVRQLAIAIVQSYLTGGTLAPVILALSGTLKFKLAEFFMNGILDVLSGIFGRRIQITPMDQLAPQQQQQPVPVAA